MPRFDQLDEAGRSEFMASIRKTDTKPELIVRRLVHTLGYGYRLHRRDLPGSPDLAFIGRKKALQVNGCFWHRHDCRLGRKEPKTNLDYWQPKLQRNVERDRENERRFNDMGWKLLVVWECELENLDDTAERIRAFLG